MVGKKVKFESLMISHVSYSGDDRKIMGHNETYNFRSLIDDRLWKCACIRLQKFSSLVPESMESLPFPLCDL